MPSDAHHGILTPKSLTFLASMFFAGIFALKQHRFHEKQLRIFSFALFFLSFLIIWLLIGLDNDTNKMSSQLDQMKLFIITFIPPLLTLFYLHERQINAQSVFKIVIYSNFIYCTGKVVLVFLHLFGIIDIWNFLHDSGILIQSMTIFEGVQRLQSSVDISTPFLLLFLLQSDRLGLKISKRFKYTYIVISLISNFLTFSRFLLFIYALSICLHLFTLTLPRLVRALTVITTIITFLILFIGVDNVATSIHHRFTSIDNFLSDQTRFEQVDALLRESEKSPYLGQGLGGYAKDYIRDRNNLHSYEVQWVAFLMQFGIVGLTILILPLAFIFIKLAAPPFTRERFAYCILFVFWLLSGFTNPFLISLQSGIIYTLFILTDVHRKRSDPHLMTAKKAKKTRSFFC
ncbi:MAG: hypothetical protein K940chlam7_00914 [Chlamydiae bacterium]|nr:hypothetical protein [Chlamydiota bacterium]